jgi:hypothetical protein
MPSDNARRAQAADAASGLDRLDRLLTEAASAPATSDDMGASHQPALFEVATAPHVKTPVRLIDLERRARFGRYDLGAL